MTRASVTQSVLATVRVTRVLSCGPCGPCCGDALTVLGDVTGVTTHQRCHQVRLVIPLSNVVAGGLTAMTVGSCPKYWVNPTAKEQHRGE